MSTLALIMVVIVALLSQSMNDRKASSVFLGQEQLRQLADVPVNLVIKQWRAAAESPDSHWASQPGAIRTYGNADGEFQKGFRLYSSPEMVETMEEDMVSDAPAADWSTRGDIWTDLNRRSGTGPLVRYPIVDPVALTQVEGFQELAALPGAEPGQLPMPVRWLYVLQDGTLGTLDDDGRFQGALAADERNPIVGRVAFWTDDESTKVNLNTATEGTFWDTPRAVTNFESGDLNDSNGNLVRKGLAACQPAQHEFQRYPGHPATTSLSAVFPPVGNESPALYRERTYGILPRVEQGGSEGGTVRPESDLYADADGAKIERLFSSVDELMFRPQPLEGSRLESARGPNEMVFTNDELAGARFFATTTSRSPELTLFGTPRVCLWPLDTDDKKRTAYDQLIGFCTSLQEDDTPVAYHFVRSDAWHPTGEVDLKRPSSGASNRDLFQYLNRLTSSPVPGLGASFSQKWEQDHPQILTQVYDFIRAVNLKDSTEGLTPSRYFSKSAMVVPSVTGPDAEGFGRFPVISEAALLFYTSGVTAVDGTRELTNMHAVLLFETNDPMAGYAGLTNDATNFYAHEVTGLDNVYVEGSDNSLPADSSKHTTLSTGASARLPFPDGVLKNNITRHCQATYHGRAHGGVEGFAHTLRGNPMTGQPYIYQTTLPVELTHPNNSTAAQTTPRFKLRGFKIQVRVTSPKTGGQIQSYEFDFPAVEIPVPDNNWHGSGFPSGSGAAVGPNFENRVNFVYNWPTSYDAPTGTNQSWRHLIQPGDTVISLQPATSDIRLNACKRVHAASDYRPHKRYQDQITSKTTMNTSPAGRKAHSLRTGVGLVYDGFTAGNLLAGIACPPTKQVDLPLSVNGVQRFDGQPGDWDAGISSFFDGAFLGKPDEGNARFFYTRLGVPRWIVPYFDANEQFIEPGPTYFSPNRQVPSGIILGSLPTGVRRERPWETILFTPYPAGMNHPGAASPPDHYLLDNFTMPVVEPWAISEPLNTAGRINMNHRLAGFPHIQRRTGLHAVLDSVRLTAVPQTHMTSGTHYKSGSFRTANYRYPLDVKTTLDAWDQKFTANGRALYVSASEVCGLPLIPKPGADASDAVNPVGVGTSWSVANINSFWNLNRLTGDNLREQPYAVIYPRLTTRTNTMTVHYQVQTIKKARSTNPDLVDLSKDRITGELRGSATVERFIDPAANLPSNRDSINLISLEKQHQFRVIGTRRF
jgi:uncharacterized protein (TIGR02600 family)